MRRLSTWLRSLPSIAIRPNWLRSEWRRITSLAQEGLTEIAAREEVEAHPFKVLLMLDNTRKVVTNDTLVGLADEVMSQLKQQTAALGV